MLIFNSYVKLPEGIQFIHSWRDDWNPGFVLGAFDLGRQEEVVPARNPLDQLLMHDFWQITPIWSWNYRFVWPQFPPILDDFRSVMVPQRRRWSVRFEEIPLNTCCCITFYIYPLYTYVYMTIYIYMFKYRFMCIYLYLYPFISPAASSFFIVLRSGSEILTLTSALKAALAARLTEMVTLRVARSSVLASRREGHHVVNYNICL